MGDVIWTDSDMATQYEHTMEMEPGPTAGLGVIGEAITTEREDLQPYLGWVVHAPRRSARHATLDKIDCMLVAPGSAATVRGVMRACVELSQGDLKLLNPSETACGAGLPVEARSCAPS